MTNNISPVVICDTLPILQNQSSVTYPLDLLIAINHKCTYHEQKILLALLAYNNFAPTIQDILNFTGITAPNHYFKSRKGLEEKGYLSIDNKIIHINVDAIMN